MDGSPISVFLNVEIVQSSAALAKRQPFTPMMICYFQQPRYTQISARVQQGFPYFVNLSVSVVPNKMISNG